MLNFRRLTAATALAVRTSPLPSFAQGAAEHEVPVTNITRGQTFTPLAVLIHARRFPGPTSWSTADRAAAVHPPPAPKATCTCTLASTASAT